MPYRKRTRIWTNLYGWNPRPLCKKDCESIEDGRHKEYAQRGPCGDNKIRHKQTELYVIPPLLLMEIFFLICFCFKFPCSINNEKTLIIPLKTFNC
jgi:hypothetical protein